MGNRRDTIRCALVGIGLEPSPHGETLDVSEGGLAWLSPVPFVPGDLVEIEAPSLFEALDLRISKLRVRVRDLEMGPDGRYRIGAALVAPSDQVAQAMRRAVLKLQRKGDELDSHVVDVLVLPSID